MLAPRPAAPDLGICGRGGGEERERGEKGREKGK